MEELDKFSKKDGFNIPDGYFDSFPGRMQKRIEVKSFSKIGVWAYILKPQFAITAIALFMIIGLGIVLTLKNESKKVAIIVPKTIVEPKKELDVNASIAQNIEKEEIKNYSIEEFKTSEIEEISKESIDSTEIIENKDYLSNLKVDEILESDIDEDLIIDELLKD